MSEAVNSPWLTVAEAAKYARVCETTIWDLAKTKRLHLGGLRSKRLIHKDHLEKQIEAGFPVLGLQEVIRPKTRRPKITKLV